MRSRASALASLLESLGVSVDAFDVEDFVQELTVGVLDAVKAFVPARAVAEAGADGVPGVFVKFVKNRLAWVSSKLIRRYLKTLAEVSPYCADERVLLWDAALALRSTSAPRWDASSDRLREALNALSVPQELLLRAMVRDGASASALAKVFGVSRETVRLLHRRATSGLREAAGVPDVEVGDAGRR